jgi:hypothetical protein
LSVFYRDTGSDQLAAIKKHRKSACFCGFQGSFFKLGKIVGWLLAHGNLLHAWAKSIALAVWHVKTLTLAYRKARKT